MFLLSRKSTKTIPEDCIQHIQGHKLVVVVDIDTDCVLCLCSLSNSQSLSGSPRDNIPQCSAAASEQ